MRSFALLLIVAACADAGDSLLDEADVDGDVTTDPSTELSVRTGDTTLWVRREIKRTGDTFVLHGRTSRNVTDGNAFVADDPYGTFTHASARTFDVSWKLSEIRPLADGDNQFVALTFAHASGKPDHLTARAVVRPRLSAFAGSTKIYVTAALEPVVVAGLTVYRLSGHTTDDNTEVTAKAGDTSFTVARAGARNFTIDFTPDQALALGDLALWAYIAGGGVTKTAHLGLELAKLGLTTNDPYAQWPRPTCTTAIKSCLVALPDGALDLGACGEAIVVNSCRGTVGVTVDDVAMQAALHDTDVQLATAASKADAVALAGADQADAFLGGAKQTVETRYEQVFGRWYVNAGARTSQLADARGAALDTAYARPLDLITPHAVHLGDAAAMRQFAADTLLAQIATQDFVHTDLERTVEQLVHDARAQHVMDIGAFRTTPAQPYPGHPEWDAYVGSWLGLYAEVAIERATGKVTNVLVEID